jgi:hypothetical protein
LKQKKFFADAQARIEVPLQSTSCQSSPTVSWTRRTWRSGGFSEPKAFNDLNVHIYRGAQFVGRFEIENQIAMDGDQLLRYLEELAYKKSSKG